jgi:hypothetical protein
MTMFEAAIIIACMLGAVLGGLAIGYDAGVKETERRWSEAVAKGDYQRDAERAS